MSVALVALGITAQVGAFAGETFIERPARPVMEIQELVKSMQREKVELIRQQTRSLHDLRAQVRDEIGIKATAAAARREFRESLEASKRQAQEQARKLAQETQQTARETVRTRD